MQKVNLSNYDNSFYKPGKSPGVRFIWYVINALFFNSYFLPLSGIKRQILRIFGAKIGTGVVIKPKVNIKYPWKLTVGEHAWIGERVWIDNLVQVTVGAHCCLSQGSFLLTGNHNYSKTGFDLMVNSIALEDGVWIGAQALVVPGTVAKSHSVLAAKSVSPLLMDAYGIYSGNRAVKVKNREIS